MDSENTRPKVNKQVLIADDDRDLVRVLSRRCGNLGIDVLTAHDALTAINLIHRHRPAVICLDVHMPFGNGLSVCDMLANDPSFSSTPLIVMTGKGNEDTVKHCHRLCAYYVEKGSDVWPRIEPLLRDLLSLPADAPEAAEVKAQPAAAATPLAGAISSPPRDVIDVVFEMLGVDSDLLDRGGDPGLSPPWILCIDDDEAYSNALRLRLETYGVAVQRAFEGMEGFRYASTRPADLILLDYELPNGRGDYILDRLKRNPATMDIPVVVITGHKDKALERSMKNLGAANFFSKPPDFPSLLAELRRHIDILPVACPA